MALLLLFDIVQDEPRTSRNVPKSLIQNAKIQKEKFRILTCSPLTMM